MNSSILSYIAFITSLIAIVTVGSFWWNFRSLNLLRKTFFTGSQGSDLEHVINSLSSNQTLEQNLGKLKNNFAFSVQKIGIVRFNPFADGGGNFSFSIALLNAHNTGVVLTSMHGREQNRIYTKKITDGASESVLTEEEKEAVVSAVTTHQKTYMV
jgi:hypothetical protein